jgi:hypothetical protein
MLSSCVIVVCWTDVPIHMRYILPLLLVLINFSAQGLSQDSDGLEIAAPPTPAPASTTLRARVYYESNGRPVRRTSVVLMGREGGPREASGLTDGNGYLTIKNVRAGKYFAIVNAPGAISALAYADVRRSRNEDSLNELFASHPSFTIDGVSDVQIEIPVKIGGAIGGRVTYADGSPAIGVKVEVLRKVGEELMPTISNLSVLVNAMAGGAGTFMTDDRGVYRFAGLPPGEYVVKATESAKHAERSSGPDFGFDSVIFGGSSSMINVFFHNALDEKDAEAIKVAMGQELVEINLTIPDRSLHAVEGKLVAAKDKFPIRNARLTIARVGDQPAVVAEYGPQRGQLTTTTDNEGKWKFLDLPKGKYRVAVAISNSEFSAEDKAYGEKSYEGNPYGAANAANAMANAANYGNQRQQQKPPQPKFSPKAVEFEVDADDLKDKIIEAEHGSRITGVVEIEKGAELPETLSITAWDPGSDLSSQTSIYTYEYGEGGKHGANTKEFMLEGTPTGSVMIRVTIADDAYYVKSMSSGAVDLLASPLDLKSAGVVSNVKIVLSKESGTLDLAVVGEDRQPVAGYQVTLVPVDPAKMRNSTFYRSKSSDGDGLARFTAAPMEYAVVSIPRGAEAKPTKDFYTWLADAVKAAPKFTIEAGKTAKGSIDGSPGPGRGVKRGTSTIP